MNISIIGGGYVGLVSAVCFADLGHNVTCIENNAKKFESLSKNHIPFYEPELAEKFQKNIQNNMLKLAPNISNTIFQSDIIILAVGTPMSDDGQANLDYLFNAVDTIIDIANEHPPTQPIILTTKSTVPVGTGANITTRINNAGLNDKISIASNPEFLREGSAIYDFFHPDRIIIGTDNETTFNQFKKLYHAVHKDSRPIVQTSLETAELSKYASNTFLAAKISFINELAILCDKVGADIKQTAKLMGMDGRIGKYFLNPSPGYGGSCFPKDTHALQFIGKEQNVDLQVVGAAIQANRNQIQHCFNMISTILDDQLENKTITILGTAFKPNTDDIRESASLKIIDMLLEKNATVHICDPEAIPNTVAIYKDRITPFESIEEAATQSDAIVLMTEWNAYKNIDLQTLKTVMRTPNFLDFRLIYTKEALNSAGFNHYILGKGIPTPLTVA